MTVEGIGTSTSPPRSGTPVRDYAIATGSGLATRPHALAEARFRRRARRPWPFPPARRLASTQSQADEQASQEAHNPQREEDRSPIDWHSLPLSANRRPGSGAQATGSPGSVQSSV
jgi:hypothetical protein